MGGEGRGESSPPLSLSLPLDDPLDCLCARLLALPASRWLLSLLSLSLACALALLALLARARLLLCCLWVCVCVCGAARGRMLGRCCSVLPSRLPWGERECVGVWVWHVRVRPSVGWLVGWLVWPPPKHASPCVRTRTHTVDGVA